MKLANGTGTVRTEPFVNRTVEPHAATRPVRTGTAGTGTVKNRHHYKNRANRNRANRTNRANRANRNRANRNRANRPVTWGVGEKG